MSKRSYSNSSFEVGDGDRVDFIHVGTEFPRLTKRQERQQVQRLKYNQQHKLKDDDTWQPSISFVSSQNKRAEKMSQKPEDFMDAQDIAENQRDTELMSINGNFSSISTRIEAQKLVEESGNKRYKGIVGTMAEWMSAEFRAIQVATTESTGDRIMHAMGWKLGHGIGPLVPTRSQLSSNFEKAHESDSKKAKVPPRPVSLVNFAPNQNHSHGIGYGINIGSLEGAENSGIGSHSSGFLPTLGALFKSKSKKAENLDSVDLVKKEKTKKQREKSARSKYLLSFDASDDEGDIYGDGASGNARQNSVLSSSKQPATSKSSLERLVEEDSSKNSVRNAFKMVPLSTSDARLCYDGKRPLSGFELAYPADTEACHYDSLDVPADFSWIRHVRKSRWDAVPASGSQSQLQLSEAKLITAKDRAKLGIIEDPSFKQCTQSALDPDIAKAALEGFMPFSDDPTKQQRYKNFLQAAAFVTNNSPVNHVLDTRETQEFAQMAHVFRPNATMLSRFTSSTQKAAEALPEENVVAATNTSNKKTVQRTVLEWAPSLLLCKRMEVKPPLSATKQTHDSNFERQRAPRQRAADFIQWNANSNSGNSEIPFVLADDPAEVKMDISKQTPVKKPDMSLFKTIFGDSDN
ncbi:hypothetical protein BX070DRAFT_254606 [Coemansia spiralis]|nr:hypothetical protein BX070DRAFT_254606 [Coemansia spiralis]